jgi:hypothetical protein
MGVSAYLIMRNSAVNYKQKLNVSAEVKMYFQMNNFEVNTETTSFCHIVVYDLGHLIRFDTML